MPFQLSNTYSQQSTEALTNSKLVTFLEWQQFEKIEVNNPFPIITNEFGGIIQYFQWGLVPVWAKTHTIGTNMAKTKLENLAEKPALQAIFQYKRCIVPVTSFSVWANKEKTAILDYTTKPNQIINLAGLWSVWGEGLNTFSIITHQRTANGQIIDWPFMLETSYKTKWLSKGNLNIDFLTNLTNR